MLTANEENDILKQAKTIIKQRKQTAKKQTQSNFETKKREEHFNTLLLLKNKIAECNYKKEHVEDHIARYRNEYLEGINHTQTQLEHDISKLGEYNGQCLHVNKHIVRTSDFMSYDGRREFYVCALCCIEL